MPLDQEALNEDAGFEVRESKGTNYVVGILLVVVVFISLLVGDFGWKNYFDALLLFLIPGAFLMARAKRNPVVIKIDNSGLYYNGKQVTDWEHFHSAVLSQDDEQVGSIQDLFILIVKHYSADYGSMYRTTIPLTNTQDKAEEEVVEAIDRYYKGSQAAINENENR